MDRARTAWRSATVAVVLTIVGIPMDLRIGREVGGVPSWPGLCALAVAVVFLAVLLAQRRRPSAKIANAIFLLDAAAIICSLWVTNEAYAASGRTWVPFQANKLGMVTVALLAPELPVGIVGIAAYAGAALIQLGTFDAAVRDRMAVGEPWATIVIGVFSGALLAHRLRRLALERKLARVQAEVVMRRRFARVFLTVRDLSNTPLQTITFAAALARARHPDLARIIGTVERSIERLRDLDHELSGLEADLDPSSRRQGREVFGRRSDGWLGEDLRDA